MYIVVIAISSVALFWALSIASFQGLDLKKRSSWLYVAVGFLCGIALSTDISNNLIESLTAGAIVAFIVLFTGVVMRRHKQKYGRWTATKSLVRKYEREDNPSLFAKLVKKLFDKYK
jgi:membrane protease YdiL (CAAX protease family)